MAYFTTHGKFVHCGRWDMDITLSGKYYFFDESKPYSARFVSATCPVAQNCSIPMNDQTEYKGMRLQAVCFLFKVIVFAFAVRV